MTFTKYTSAAIRSTVAAGEMIKHFKKTKLLVSEKESPRDLVSEVDLLAEKIIIDNLSKEFGNISYLSEEAGDHLTDIDNYWIIDPLDGTTNFINNLPIYGVSIAFVKQGVLHSAAIYLPETLDLYFAEKNLGAYMNNKRLKIAPKSLKSSLISVTFPGAFSNTFSSGVAYDSFADINASSRGALRLGSSVYSLAMLASGNLHGVIGFEAKIWDIAAGLLINTEAGAKASVTDNTLLEQPHTYSVASGVLSEALSKVIGVKHNINEFDKAT